MERWKPHFNSYHQEAIKVVVWIRLPNLPVEYYNKDVLFMLGNSLGKTFKVDLITQDILIAKFARLIVELDITKPLKTIININVNGIN